MFIFLLRSSYQKGKVNVLECVDMLKSDIKVVVLSLGSICLH